MGLRRASLIGLMAPVLAFANAPEILFNRQGLAQQDLSIRGSSYTGAGISINGLNLKAPWSAHFNSELPIAGHLLSAPDVQTGLNNISGHLVGTAAYQTVPQEDGAQASGGIGTKEHYSAGIASFSAGVGGFLDGEKAQRVDRAANDYERYSGGAHLQHLANDWQIDLIGAHQQKKFGTRGYSGIGTGEQTVADTLLFFGATKGELADSFLRTSAAFRQMEIDEADARFGAVMLEGRTMEIQHMALTLRGDVENEYADGQDRTRGSVLVLPEVRFERFTLKAGLNSIFQTAESAEWLPQAGIDWLVTDNATLYAAYSENVQQPDFQTLKNNPLLQQQKSQNTELGFRQFVSARLDWRAAAFHRRVENASDGVAATDLGTLNVAGVDSTLRFYPSNDLELQAYYQWIHKDNIRAAGLYESDYPEHLLAVAGHWKFTRGLTIFGTQTLRWQTNNSARTGNDFGADASVGLHWFPRFAHNARLSFRVDNLWGSNFQAIPGLKPRDRTASTRITVAW